MIDAPRTLEDARKRRYGEWAGNPRGHAFDPMYCAYEVPENRGWSYRQCGRRPGKGPAGLYCGTHANVLVREDAYKARSARSSSATGI